MSFTENELNLFHSHINREHLLVNDCSIYSTTQHQTIIWKRGAVGIL